MRYLRYSSGIAALTVLFSGSSATWAQPLTPGEAERYASLDARPIYEFDHASLAEYLQLKSRASASKPPQIGDEIGRYSTKFLRQPYRMNGDRFDLAESGCVTFVERCLALAYARDWETFYKLSERLRHRDGIVEYQNRNFLTLADWVSNNKWMLRDITGELKGPSDLPASKTFRNVVRPKIFRPMAPDPITGVAFVFDGCDYRSPDKQVKEETFVPVEQLEAVLGQLRTGDIALIIRQFDSRSADKASWLDCDHMGVVVRRDDDVVTLVFNSPPRARQQSLQRFVQYFDFVRGFKFLRPQPVDIATITVRAPSGNTPLAIPAPGVMDDMVRRLRDRRNGN